MSEEQRRILEQQLWNIANTLRGKMNADEFRDYILGFIFYKYLSAKMNAYADDILEADGISYQSIDEGSAKGKRYLDAIREEAVESLGFFLKPSELFSAVAARGNGNRNNFILEDLQRILNNIESSTMGTESEDDFDHLFEDLDLNSTKLGREAKQRNELIAKVLSHLDKIDFRLEETEADVLGDAYEYLISQFAAGAGKKAGEFYTPQEVSKVLAKIVTSGKERLKTVYDPTCGSGSLLLRVAREVKDVGKFYGQELNRTTYNLCRMNMILHGVNYRKFDIKQEDSLEHDQHSELVADAIVANPPFSAKWSANELFLGDDRFSQYGRLAPASKADFAFIQHMIHHLSENGTMAVVAPHGVLFRGAAEGHIRRYLIEDRNYLDAVIGLPANIFYGTGIPTCVLVLKKCKEHFNDILFIDASRGFEKRGNQNRLRDEDIEKIISTYRERTEIEKYSYLATLEEVRENGYNLNIPRYVDIFEEEQAVDLEVTTTSLHKLNEASIKNDKIIVQYCFELGLPVPIGNNIDLLTQYKKGVMQEIFSKRIRFKDPNGNAFPDWKRKRLGEIGSTYGGLTGKSAEDFGEGSPFITYKQIFDDPRIDSSRFGYVRIECDERQNKVQFGDVLFTTSSETPGEVAYASVLLMEVDDLYLNSFCFGYRASTKELSPYFAQYLFRSYGFRKKVFPLAQGSTRYNISKSEVMKLWFDLPCPDEQNLIAEFLSAIDAKIESVDQQIMETKTYKKGLLQQMFV